MNLPPIVTVEEWQDARDALLVKEMELTRAGDALNAERRQLPMVKIDKKYVFEGPNGPVSLLDLFEGRRQLILYNFMYTPDDEAPCTGCSMLVDNFGHPAHLHARDTSRVLVSRAPLEKLRAVQTRMGWRTPWYSSFGSDFNYDFGASTDEGETFALNVFLRDGENVYRTYSTNARGAEHLGSNWTYLDLTPFGRQENWENSPEGWPQSEPYVWWRYHDSYAG